ncbi:MAG: Fic family protein [Candidatus Nomurabacteria bacterium]|jgi:Fic family protein|nr:Fic family protein [Candidatus Nomurabacteria bacterium]
MIRTPEPKFNSELTETIIRLEHLRGRKVGGTTNPLIFMQLKNLFHIVEALSSARIEGNHTTLLGFIAKKNANKTDESMREITNLMEALDFIDQNIADSQIDRNFILELHRIVVKNLTREGDDDTGGYRRKNVRVGRHNPPSHYDVPDLMRELVDYIDEDCNERTDLLKIAIAHHQFVWIHPFGNGNGRTVRLLTYAMLCQRGYITPNAMRLFNPTAVFAGNRNEYYDMLEKADRQTDEGILAWCGYFLSGIFVETEKTQKLADKTYVNSKLLIPAIEKLNSAGVLTVMETGILNRAAKNGSIKAADIADLWDKPVTSSAIANQIKKLRDANYLMATKPNGREYVLRFTDNVLTGLTLMQMEDEGLLPERVNEV